MRARNSPHILFVDNNQSIDEAKFSPMLVEIIQRYAKCHVVRTVDEVHLALSQRKWDGAVLSGSSANLSAICPNRLMAMNGAVLHHISQPILGICFGMQVIALLLGGKVESLPHPCRCKKTIFVHFIT